MSILSKPNQEGEAPADPSLDKIELPEGWTHCRVDDVFNVSSGGTPSRTEPKYWNGNVPWLSSGDIKTDEIEVCSEFITEAGLQNSTAKLCDAGSVVVVVRSGVLKHTLPVALLRRPAAINQDIKCFNAGDDDLNRWLALALRTASRDILAENREGTTVQSVKSETLREFAFPLPPLAEQHRIVAKLEELLGRVSRAKARLDRIPALLKRFRQSVLAAACSGKLTDDWRDVDVVSDELPETWKSVVFDSMMQCNPQNGLYKPQSSYGSGTRIVRIDAFYDGAIAPWKDLKRLELTQDEIALYGLSNGDLLINRVNSMKFLGKSALVRELSEPCVFESNMMRVRLKLEVVDPEYAVLYLQSWPGIQELRKNAKHAVNQSSINQNDVRSVAFNLPPLEEQQEIVRRVEQLFSFADQIEARLTKAQAQVDRLTQSILAKAFRGELVPTEAELARREGRDYEPASKLLERVRMEATSMGSTQRKKGRKETKKEDRVGNPSK
jgi:type I restriction enzyme S subunit